MQPHIMWHFIAILMKLEGNNEMRIVLINGSPRANKSTSAHFLETLIQQLPEENIVELQVNHPRLEISQIKEIQNCDALVFCFPVYVDAIPSHLVKVLQELISVPFQTKPTVYALINCGFYEGEHAQLCLEMLKHWCNRIGFPWGQGLGIGGGEMFGQLKKVAFGFGPKKTLGKALTHFAQNIKTLASGSTQYVSPNFPRSLFVLFGSQGWKAQAKANGLAARDLYKNPY